MKKIFSIIVLSFFSIMLWSQGTTGAFEIWTEKDPATGAILVKIKPLTATAAAMDDILYDITFQIIWDASYGSQIDLDPSTVTGAMFDLNIQPTKYAYTAAGVPKYFRTFGRGAAPPILITSAWPVGTSITLLSIKPLLNGVTNPVGDFHIANLTPGYITGVMPGSVTVEAFSNVSIEQSTVVQDYLPAVTAFAPAVPLPIELLSFDVKSEKDFINLDWRTANEENFRGFDVERSTDAKNFEKLTFIAGKGVTNGTEYKYEDRTAQKGNLYYYRLKMLENDGSFEYSPLRNAMIPLYHTPVNIYPNPSNGNVNLEFTLEEETPTQVDVFDMLGQLMLHKEIETKKDKNLVSLDMLNLPSGLYSIRVDINHKIQTKLVKIAKK
jgi:hypothetical protein